MLILYGGWMQFCLREAFSDTKAVFRNRTFGSEYQCWEVVSGRASACMPYFFDPPGQLVGQCVKQDTGLDRPLVCSSRAKLIFLCSHAFWAGHDCSVYPEFGVCSTLGLGVLKVGLSGIRSRLVKRVNYRVLTPLVAQGPFKLNSHEIQLVFRISCCCQWVLGRWSG